MSNYYAQTDPAGVVQRVVVADSAAWCTEHLGGSWVQTADPYTPANGLRYAGPGYRWDAEYGQFFPWSADTLTGTMWCPAASWDALDVDTQTAFLEQTGLVAARETITAVEYVVFGGRTITEDDQLALTEVI